MNFVTIDFETAKYSRESACSVGMVKYQDGKEVDSYYSLIRPPVLYIRPDFTGIHGLTIEDVKDAPAFADIWEVSMVPFIGKLPLAAHNAPFDMGVLRSVLDWYGIKKPFLRNFCTLNLSRRAWPDLESHALSFLAAHFGIIYEAHNALADARTCGDIVFQSAQKYEANDLRKMLKAAGMKLDVL